MSRPVHNLRGAALGALAIVATGVAIGVAIHLVTTEREVYQPVPPQRHATGISLTQQPDEHAPREEPLHATTPVEDDDSTADQATGCGDQEPDRTGALLVHSAQLAEPFLIYLPKNYDPNVQHPVILLFHDAGEPPELLITDGRFAQIADRHNVILVAPRGQEVFDGTGLYMRVWETQQSREEIPVIWQQVQERFCVDRHRVYAVGQAAGGYAVEGLMCELPLAGAATHAHVKLPDDPTCEPKGRVPYLALWGDSDPFAPQNGRENCIGIAKMSWEASVERWRAYNNAHAAAERWTVDAQAKCTTWAGDATFAYCALQGGREWPWSRPRIWSKLLPHCESRPATFDAARLVWDFFTENTPDHASATTP